MAIVKCPACETEICTRAPGRLYREIQANMMKQTPKLTHGCIGTDGSRRAGQASDCRYCCKYLNRAANEKIKPPDILFAQVLRDGSVGTYMFNPLEAHDNGKPVYIYRLEKQ